MTPDARVQELLPCPLCSKAPLFYPRTRVCAPAINCGCGVTFSHGPDDASCVAAWNRRSTPETERLRSALEEARWYVREIKRLRDGFRFESPDADALLTRIDSLLTQTRDPQ